ncbi:secondary thiamine-phosphate synthase enzyme YjbQ [Acidobacteria bacterium AH-259-L09]|nr:secondary thiamine-phosphate synthase enzyme YjbQ [Acidobacteria bacterium AH-259-L09]
MKQEIRISTSRHIEMKEITRQLRELVHRQGFKQGICMVYCPHTTAGLLINENADPDVCSDLERAFEKVVPEIAFEHVEGNSPSHFLSCITGSSLNLLVEDSRLQLGRWQGVFFCEFDGPRQRTVWVYLQGS